MKSSPDPLTQAEARIRQAAQKDRQMKFTSLLHHIYSIPRLHRAFYRLRKNGAVGVDEVSWKTYHEEIDERLRDLSQRLARGSYRPQPVRRVLIPKGNGKMRALGIPTIEDKLVQQATVEVLNCIYEVDFKGVSYGFRPGRHQHMALDALYMGIEKRKVNIVLDADIRGFFDAVNQDWMLRFLGHRIADPRLLRMIAKILRAGVMVDGEVQATEQGTPQGGVISPLLANIYLHYVLDLWVLNWRKAPNRREVTYVRYADDFVVGFQSRLDANRFHRMLKERLQRFGLELHGEKSQLIEFGRYAAERRARRGAGKPKSFTFLGFLHVCGTWPDGKFKILRQTDPSRFRRKLKSVKGELRRRMHHRVSEVGRWLRQVFTGHCNYFAVQSNKQAIKSFRRALKSLWKRTLIRRSQKGRRIAKKFKRIVKRYLPTCKTYHLEPYERFPRQYLT